jgi:hypothetical protein
VDMVRYSYCGTGCYIVAMVRYKYCGTGCFIVDVAVIAQSV